MYDWSKTLQDTSEPVAHLEVMKREAYRVLRVRTSVHVRSLHFLTKLSFARVGSTGGYNFFLDHGALTVSFVL